MFNTKTVSGLCAEFTKKFQDIQDAQTVQSKVLGDAAKELEKKADVKRGKQLEADKEASRAARMKAKVEKWFEDDDEITLPTEPINDETINIP